MFSLSKPKLEMLEEMLHFCRKMQATETLTRIMFLRPSLVSYKTKWFGLAFGIWENIKQACSLVA